MKRGGTIGGALGVLMLTAMFLVRGPGAGPGVPSSQARGQGKATKTGGKEKKAKAPNVTLLPEEGPWRASRDHYAGLDGLSGCKESVEHPKAAKGKGKEQDPPYRSKDTLELEQDDKPATNIGRPRYDLWKIPNCEKVQAMIAVVPDPVHTHLALVFDRSVEALQLAAESSNYVVDRFWLPWQTESKGEWTEYESYREAEKDERARLQQPGLLIFRYNGEIEPEDLPDSSVKSAPDVSPGAKGAAPSALRQANLLYVFLVADTSTAGINGAQFSKAIEYVKQICDSPRGCTTVPTNTANNQADTKVERRIHIMGPMFSGSLASLRQLTRVAQASFTAYSGTVSSICAMQDQHLAIAPAILCNTQIDETDLTAWLEFRSFVADSELSVHRFIQLLKDNEEIKCGDGNPEVAILAESATTYGAAQRSAGRQSRSPKRQGKSRAPQDDRAAEVSDLGNCSASFSYPREISSLRNAYHAATGASSVADKAGDSSRPYLSFTLVDQQNNSDEPQEYAGQQGPLSKEAVMMKMAAELRNQKYKYIGIIGTNALDVLFLSNFLRTAYPDARLFLISSDLMFERELDNASLIGTLSVSTYPLISRNLDWTRPGLDRLPFSDQFEEGQYNATIHLLHQMIPGHSLRPYEMSKPFTAPPSGDAIPKSPIWLTMVGTGGYWPVKMLDVPDKSVPPSKLVRTDFSLAWASLEVLLCALAVLHALVLLMASPVAPRLRDFSMVAALPAQRLFFIHIGSAILALTVAMMAMPAWRFDGGQNGPVGWIAYAAQVAIAFLLITCALLDFTYLVSWFRETKAREKRTEERKQQWWRPPIGVKVSLWLASHAAVWSFAWCLGQNWARIFDHDANLYGFFFAYRAVHMATGVSPMTPMLPLLAAGYVWSIFEIWRLRFNDQLRPRLNPNFCAPPSPLLAGGLREQAISDALRRYMLGTNYTVAFLLVFALWLMFFVPSHPFQLVEASKFGRLYEIFFCVVVLMLLSAGFRFGQVWSVLRRMLNDMERTPVRFTFQRLKHSDWSPIWRQGGEEPEWVNMSRSIEVLRKLKDPEEDNAISTFPASLAISITKVTATDEEVREYAIEVLRKLKDSGDGGVASRLPPSLTNAIENAKAAAEKVRESYAGLQKQHLIQDWLRAYACWIGCCWQAWRADTAEDAKRASVEKDKARKNLSTASARFGSAIGEFRNAGEEFAGLQVRLAEALHEVLNALPERWQTLDCEPADDTPSNKDLEVKDAVKQALKEVAENISEDTDDPAKKEKARQIEQVACMEAFVAWRYEGFIRNVLFHMKHLLFFLAISFSLVLVSLNLYAFEPHQSLIWSLTVIFIVLGLLTIVGLMQIHRDPILSRMSGTQPNDLGLEFYVRILSLGAAPLITLLATHFPSIGRALVSLLQPGLEALK